jgi:hypothetical protein
MQRLRKLVLVGIAALGIAPAFALFDDSDIATAGQQDLLLRARGNQPARLESGKVRVPIDVDGVAFEVIVSKPGTPELTPAVPRETN